MDAVINLRSDPEKLLVLTDASTVFREFFWDPFRREVREAND